MDSPLITFLLFLCLGLCVLATQPRACAALRRRRGLAAAGERLGSLIEKHELFLLLPIALLALWARAYLLTDVPAGLSAEEALVGVQARALLQTGGAAFTGRLTAQLNVWGGGQTGPLLSLLAVPFVAAMGLTVLSVRLPMLLLHLIALFAFYDLCRRIGGRRAARIGFFLYALAPGLVMQSRWALSAHALGPMLVLSLWALSLSQRRKSFYFLSMALFGLSMYACDAAWYVLPPFILALSLYAVASRRLPWGTVLAGACLYLLAALPALLTLLVNTFGLEGFTLLGVEIPRFAAFEHAGRGALTPDPSVFRGADAFDTLMDNGFRYLEQTLVQLQDSTGASIGLYALPNFGLYQLFMLPVAVLGGFAFLVQLRRPPKEMAAMGAGALPCVASALLLMAMSLFCVLFRDLDAAHFAMALPLLILLCAKGTAYIARRIPLAGAVLCLAYTVCFGLFVGQYYAENSPARAEAAHYRGFTEAAAYASTLDVERIHVSSNVAHPGGDQVVRVLTAFGFDLPAADLIGQMEGDDFAGRFSIFRPEAQTPSPAPGVIYLLRAEDTQTLDEASFTERAFGDWVVLESRQ